MALILLVSTSADDPSARQRTIWTPPVAALSAKPTTINPGQSATLAFSAPDAHFCKSSSQPRDPDFVVRGRSGKVVVRPTSTTSYTINCKKGSASAERRVTVSVTSDPIVLSEIFDGAAAHASRRGVKGGELRLPTWKSVYHGYGSNSVARLFDGQALAIQPKGAISAGETHAGLITGPYPSWPVDMQGAFTLEASLHTEKQLRRKDPPNPWEVAWLAWDYIDDSHFYYFIPKPTGWELGKRDPAYPGGQRFLASGNSPKYSVGNRYVVKVVQAAAPTSTTLSVSVDGAPLTTFIDRERPYSNGLVGFYSEDALIYVHSVVVTTPRAAAAEK